MQTLCSLIRTLACVCICVHYEYEHMLSVKTITIAGNHPIKENLMTVSRNSTATFSVTTKRFVVVSRPLQDGSFVLPTPRQRSSTPPFRINCSRQYVTKVSNFSAFNSVQHFALSMRSSKDLKVGNLIDQKDPEESYEYLHNKASNRLIVVILWVDVSQKNRPNVACDFPLTQFDVHVIIAEASSRFTEDRTDSLCDEFHHRLWVQVFGDYNPMIFR